MLKLIIPAAIFFLPCIAYPQLTMPPDGGNRVAIAGERVGITDITIHYSRPSVKGREGKIWGGIVPFGFTDLGFGTSKSAPWRAGANENTVIEFTTDVIIEGKPLAAGKYGFFIAVDSSKCTLIFSRNYTSWGSFFYTPEEDALRVNVQQQVQEKSTEWLTYSFEGQDGNSVVVALYWERWKIPFSVEVDYVTTQLESFRRELRSDKGFTWTAWRQAAKFCADNNVNLEEALAWSDYAINGPFIGEKNFQTLTTRALVLNKMKKTAEADALIKEALPLGSMNEVHGYARQLLQDGKKQEAFTVFKMNYDKHPGTFTTNMGMTRAYAALGDYKKALQYAEAALPQATDPGNKVNVQSIIEQLKSGKDIN